jgi:hypothetical protein
MGALSSFVSTLTSAGVTQTTIPTILQTLANLSPNAAINQACHIILANSNNPTVVKDEATKLAEVANLPAGVAALLPSLENATTPMQVVQAVQAIEAAIGGASGLLGLPSL